MSMIRLSAAFICMLFFTLTCSDSGTGGSSCGESPAYDASGDWQITITVTGGNRYPDGTEFTATLTVEQDDTGNLQGSIETEGGLTSDFSGTVCGTNVNFKITQGAPCKGTFSGQVQLENGGTTFSGSYSGNDCDGSLKADISGILDLNVDPVIISNNETWSGTIYLRSSVTINSGAKLTIEPGTVIKIASRDFSSNNVDAKIDITCRGELVANGSAENIIQFIPESSTPANDEWWGLELTGNGNLSYCVFQSAQWGLFLFSITKSIQIEKCFFKSCREGIINFGPDIDLNNITFTGISFSAYNRWRNDHTDNINYCHFEDNAYDVRIIASSDSSVNNIIHIDNSNFVNSTHNSFSFYGDVRNSIISLYKCYGVTDIDNSYLTNRLVVTNALSSSIEGAGCGFENVLGKLPAGLNKNADLGPEDRMQKYYQHNKQISAKEIQHY